MLAASTYAFAWWKTEASARPPAIPNYNWAQHPDALLLVYPPHDCGCAPASSLASIGLQYGLDVVVVAAAPTREINALGHDKLPAHRLSIITNSSPALIKSLGALDKPVSLRIRDGRVVRRSVGGVPPDSFFRDEEVKK